MRLKLRILTSSTAVGLHCIVEATTVMINALPGSPDILLSSVSKISVQHTAVFHVSVGAAVLFGVEWRTVHHVSCTFYWTNDTKFFQPRGGVSLERSEYLLTVSLVLDERRRISGSHHKEQGYE